MRRLRPDNRALMLGDPPQTEKPVSVEDQERARRAIALSRVPAHIRFLSIEPLLGPIKQLPLDGFTGSLSAVSPGPGARAIEPGWVDDLLDQCRANGVPFF